MLVRRVFALMAMLACATGVLAAEPLPPTVRHHNMRLTPQQQVQQRLHQQRSMQDASFTPVMAYHEEPSRSPRPLYEAQWDLEDFHSSGSYDNEMSNVVTNAQLFATQVKASNNSAWVFDVDETSLSGYSEMLSIGFGFVAKLNHEWIMSASAPAIPQTLALYKQLVSSGFKIIFLTGRKDIEHDATAQNLRNEGYNTFETLITRVPAEYNLTATEYKSARRTELTELSGYNIVGCVGDQWSDLNGPYTGLKVKLPNYIYYLP